MKYLIDIHLDRDLQADDDDHGGDSHGDEEQGDQNDKDHTGDHHGGEQYAGDMLTCAEICKDDPLGNRPLSVLLGGLHENKGNWGRKFKLELSSSINIFLKTYSESFENLQ